MRAALRLIVSISLASLGACDQAPSLDAPKLVQLSCVSDKSQESVVLILDTARKQVKWVNARTPVQGEFWSTPSEYRFTLAPTVATQALQGVVNRFDGRLHLVWGAAKRNPLAGDVSLGPDARIWRCNKQISGPLL